MESFDRLYKMVHKDINRRELPLSTTSNTYAWLYSGSDKQKGADKLYHEAAYVCFGWTARDTTRLAKVDYLIHARCFCKLPLELQESYIRWVIEESPYKGTILNSVEDILNDSIVIGDAVNSPLNLMYGAMFCIRMAHERSVIIDMWGRLVEGGVPKALAFILVNCFSYGQDGRDSLLEEIPAPSLTPGRCSTSDHMPLYTQGMSKKDIINFLSDTPKALPTPPLCINENGIHKVQSAWCEDGVGFYDKENIIKGWFEGHLCRKAVHTNPFMNAANSIMPAMTLEEAALFCTNNWKNFLEWLND